MRRKEFKITGKRDFDVVAENFTSTAEVIAVTRTRPPCDESWKNRRDYLNETWDNGQEPPGHGWEGFSGKEEFEELIHLGVRDTSMLKDVRKYSAKATVKEKDKLAVQCRDVVGGGVDVPTFLTGNPQCMYALKRKKVKSKIIEIGIECGLTCDYSVNQYKKAGMALTKVVAKLEKAGYRVALISMSAFLDERNDRICMMTNIIKRENAPMNYSRIMFPLTSIGYFRGLGFGWIVRLPEYKGYSGLGPHISSCFRIGEENEGIENMFRTAIGHDNFIAVSMKQMVRICDREGQEKLEKYIESKVMDVVG